MFSKKKTHTHTSRPNSRNPRLIPKGFLHWKGAEIKFEKTIPLFLNLIAQAFGNREENQDREWF